MDEMEVKKCGGRCGQIKPVSEFYKRGDRPGYRSKCIACLNAEACERIKSQRLGTYVPKQPKKHVPQKPATKVCKGPCSQEKPIEQFRPYVTKKDGKEYEYYSNFCRACEAHKESVRRFAQKFNGNNNLFFNIDNADNWLV